MSDGWCALTPVVSREVRHLIDVGALFVLNDSGGKDSQAMRIALRDVVPRKQLLIVHAHLPGVEWPGAIDHARAGADMDGIPFVVAVATKTLLGMVEDRWRRRPDVPSWPSAAYRQCTSDLKRDPIAREIRRFLRSSPHPAVVSCLGIRAAESSGRAKRSPLKTVSRFSTATRPWWEWLPIHGASRNDVLATIDAAGERPHWAYSAGNDRLSCMFCIMASRSDLRNAALHNPDLYRHYVELEHLTGYTMHQSRTPLVQLTGVPVK